MNPSINCLLALLFFLFPHFSHAQYLQDREPEDPNNNCLMEESHYNEHYLSADEFDHFVLGFPLCGREQLAGAFKLVALQYAEQDNNVLAGCQIKTEYLACNYPTQNQCVTLSTAQQVFNEQLDRDWCGQLRTAEIMPPILFLLDD